MSDDTSNLNHSLSEESAYGKQSIVTEAKERYLRAKGFYAITRTQAIDDTRFVMGDSDNLWQWPTDVSNARVGDRRVCLTVNSTAQHCNNIINQIRQNRPSGRVMPVDDFSDEKTAEILAGLIRNIQTSSNADDAHDIAAEHAVYGGEGFWRIITEYESSSSFNQVIKIKPCVNPQLVYIDECAIAPDKSDAEWGMIFEDVKKETVEREYPKLKGDIGNWSEDIKTQWVTKETVRVAEYYYLTWIEDKALLLSDGSSVLESKLHDTVRREKMQLINDDGSRIEIIEVRDTFRKQWKWCKLIGGHDIPVEETDWLGEYLPIVAVVGKEVNVNGQKIIKGIVRDVKDAQRMVNYAYSEAVQSLALQNKVPYLIADAAIEGFEDIWKSANLQNHAYLPWNAFDDNGQALPRPERQQPPTMPAALLQLLQVSTEEMRAASGQQNANFGIRSEASSGIGIQRLKQQGEIATFHFPDNLARALKYEAVILIDLIQKYYDSKRVVRVLGLDGTHDTATLDPAHPVPYSENRISEDDIKKIFNPTVGQYDVVIDTGPSFQTQRQEAFAALTDLASKSPALMQVAGDIIMRAADFPQAQELADRLKKTLPPGLQDEKEGGKDAQLAQATQAAQQMQQQLEQMQQSMQEMQAKLQQAESGAQKTQMEIQSKQTLAAADMQHKQELAKFTAQLDAQRHDIEIEAQQQLAAFEANLIQQKQERDIEARQQEIMMNAKFKREEAAINAAIQLAAQKQAAEADLTKSHFDACSRVQMNSDNNESKEDIAELNAYVELQKVGIENAGLTQDVNSEFSEETKGEEYPSDSEKSLEIEPSPVGVKIKIPVK